MSWDDYDPCEDCDADPDFCDICGEKQWKEEVAEQQREEAISKGDDPIIFSEDLME